MIYLLSFFGWSSDSYTSSTFKPIKPAIREFEPAIFSHLIGDFKHSMRIHFAVQFASLTNKPTFVDFTLWKDELRGVRGPLLLGVQENKQTREEQDNRI